MYPLKFLPVFQQRIWGGKRLRAVLQKAVPEVTGVPFGESWELADLPSGTVKGDNKGADADGALSSVIANGKWAGRKLRDVWGNPDLRFQISNFKFEKSAGHFPLLIKFLDAAADLSVQVHPDAPYCAKHPGAHLKSEAWYVLHAEPGAKIYKGVKRGVTREQFKAALETGAVEPLLNAIPVRTGDCHYLQSGTVHALGAGILAAEVQTPSDTTFRVFDWNRLGPDGKARTLHIAEALECIDFSQRAEKPVEGIGSPVATRLVSNEYFTLDRYELPAGDVQTLPPEMAIWIIVDGQGVLTCDGSGPTAFARGDTILLPAGMTNPELRTIARCVWLEAKVPAMGA